MTSVECYRLVLFVPHDGSIGHWDWLQNGFAIRSQHGLTVRGTTEKGECATDTERTIKDRDVVPEISGGGGYSAAGHSPTERRRRLSRERERQQRNAVPSS